MEQKLKDIIERKNKLKNRELSSEDLLTLEELIKENINDIKHSGDKIILKLGKSELPLFYINYNQIDGSLKKLSESIKNLIYKKSKNENYSLKDFSEERYKDLMELLQKKKEYEEKYGEDVFQNRLYRERIIEYILNKKYSSFKRLNKKIDYIIPELHINLGEMKSAKTQGNAGVFKNCTFEFDKQNDPIRRENTLKSDSFLFAGFDKDDFSDGKVLFYSLITEHSDVLKIKDLIRKKQDEFVTKNENTEKQISRDTIQISLSDLIELNLSFFNENNEEIKVTT